MKIKGQFVRNYRNKKGNTVFVYTVSGTPAELEAYAKAQGENLRHVDDDPSKAMLFFTTRYSGDNIILGITAAGSVFVDTSELDKAASLAAQFGGNLGQELARNSAASILKSTSNSTVSAPAPVVASTEDMDKV